MSSYDDLLARIALVRRRWRSQVLVKGIALFLASTIALLILGIWGADLFGFKPAVVWGMRVVSGCAAAFIAWRFLYLPLSVRVSNIQIAQYVEENFPRLEDRLVAAVEYGRDAPASSGLIDLLIKDALDKTSRVDFSVFTKPARLAGFGFLGMVSFLALFSLLTWGPSFFPYGFSRLYVPWTEASLGSSMGIRILPGDVEIAKGADQQIQAQLVGFDSPDVRLFIRPAPSDSWNTLSMEPDPRGSIFRYLLIDIQNPLQYYVASKGVRSRTYLMKVIDLARAERIDLTYHFPAYTGMPDQVVEDEGDISALKGTGVDLRIHLSRQVPSARLLFDDKSTVELRQSGAQDYTGSVTVRRSGSYVVEIAGENGKRYKGSPEYRVETIEDGVPRVTITRPMRDVRATSVEEVFSETKAEDDIGVNSLELHYSINGGPEKIVDLYSGKPPGKSIVGAHTFYLEEFGLKAGDLISYYAKATDDNSVDGPGTAVSDIYFINIRPFEQRYVQSQQAGGQGGGAGEEGQQVLSARQKEIISATFRLIREKEKMAKKEYQDGLRSAALVQSRLQAQTRSVVDRLKRRGADQADENFAKLSEYLKNAVDEMGKAAVNLGAQKPGDAMPQEQKSLQQLMRAESLFREIQVSFAQSGSGGSSQANAEDLADLFELELNKLKNQYETIQRGEQQQRDQKVDEALQRVKELAQRQQQLNERNRMLARRGFPQSSSGGGSGQNQQQLLDQAEELQRQLQRLSRERSSPQLNEASNQLRKAIENMRRAMNDSQRGNEAEANAQGIRALQQLNEVARRLARNQQANLNEGVGQAVDESKKLVEEQDRIQEGLDRLAGNRAEGASSEETRQRAEDLVDRKKVLSDRLENLENRIQDLSQQARRNQEETSRRLADAAGSIREKRLPQRILNGAARIQNGMYEDQRERENFIRGGLAELNQQLQDARNSLGRGEEGRVEEAANRARRLSEGLESMQQRLSGMQQGQQGRQGSRQQGQEGQRQGQAQRGTQPGERQGQGSRAANAQERRGDNPQDLQGGFPGPEVDVRSLSRNASGPPSGGRDRGDYRQLQSEFGQRLLDAQELRRLLDRNRTQAENLDKVIEALRRAGNYRDYDDPEQLARLKTAIDYTHRVESDLNRELDRLNRNEKYFFAEDNEAPAGYRKLVEEYYRSIAKAK